MVSNRLPVEYETWRIDYPRTASRSQILRELTDQAEYGRWELWRVVRFVDGRCRVWLRRRRQRILRSSRAS
ncbi:MAG: DUF5703 family protein [Actinomycetes bacterium]